MATRGFHRRFWLRSPTRVIQTSDSTVPILHHPNNSLYLEPHSFPCTHYGGYIRNCVFGWFDFDLTLPRLVWNIAFRQTPWKPRLRCSVTDKDS